MIGDVWRIIAAGYRAGHAENLLRTPRSGLAVRADAFAAAECRTERLLRMIRGGWIVHTDARSGATASNVHGHRHRALPAARRCAWANNGEPGMPWPKPYRYESATRLNIGISDGDLGCAGRGTHDACPARSRVDYYAF